LSPAEPPSVAKKKIAKRKIDPSHHGGNMQRFGWKTQWTRRALLDRTGSVAAAGMVASIMGLGALAATPAQAALGKPEPEEKVAETIKRLFGDRKIEDGSTLMKLDAPAIAENGSVVPVKVEITQETTPQKYVKKIYFIADKNRRPMSASFMLTPDVGKPFIGTNLRLGGTTQVRAIAEMSDGKLIGVAREVKVTVGGCGG
jgi:sulfur-oxidizing protein SoxY